MGINRKNRALAFAIALAASTTLQAADRFWVTGNGPFGSSSSWSTIDGGPSGASVPGLADIANFTLPTTYTVVGSTNATVQQVAVKAGTVTLDLAGLTLTATLASGYRIGTTTTDVARLTLLDGTLNVSTAFNNVEIGSSNDITGFLTMSTGARFTGQPDMVVGGFGSGTLTVQNGATIDGARAFIAENLTGIGTATVTGAGSRWTNTNEINVGYDGFGTFNITAGGFVSTVTSTFLGVNSPGTGTATVSGTGSALSTGGLTVGVSGTGTLSVRSGA